MKKYINLVKNFMKNKIVKRIWSCCTNLIICILLVLVIMSVYGNIKTQGKDFRAPSIGSYMWMSVLSNSMKPTFNTGDLVIARKVDVNDLKAGDIITFRWSTALATHRITEVIKDANGRVSFKTKGDYNNTEDQETLDSNYVVGKYMFRIPFIGYILAKLKGLAGVILIWILFAAVVGNEIYKHLKDSRQKKTEESVISE